MVAATPLQVLRLDVIALTRLQPDWTGALGVVLVPLLEIGPTADGGNQALACLGVIGAEVQPPRVVGREIKNIVSRFDWGDGSGNPAGIVIADILRGGQGGQGPGVGGGDAVPGAGIEDIAAGPPLLDERRISQHLGDHGSLVGPHNSCDLIDGLASGDGCGAAPRLRQQLGVVDHDFRSDFEHHVRRACDVPPAIHHLHPEGMEPLLEYRSCEVPASFTGRGGLTEKDQSVVEPDLTSRDGGAGQAERRITGELSRGDCGNNPGIGDRGAGEGSGRHSSGERFAGEGSLQHQPGVSGQKRRARDHLPCNARPRPGDRKVIAVIPVDLVGAQDVALTSHEGLGGRLLSVRGIPREVTRIGRCGDFAFVGGVFPGGDGQPALVAGRDPEAVVTRGGRGEHPRDPARVIVSHIAQRVERSQVGVRLRRLIPVIRQIPFGPAPDLIENPLAIDDHRNSGERRRTGVVGGPNRQLHLVGTQRQGDGIRHRDPPLAVDVERRGRASRDPRIARENLPRLQRPPRGDCSHNLGHRRPGRGRPFHKPRTGRKLGGWGVHHDQLQVGGAEDLRSLGVGQPHPHTFHRFVQTVGEGCHRKPLRDLTRSKGHAL